METSVNNKCKAFTSLEQSTKLAEILPTESADMWWSKNFIYYNPTAAIGISAEYSNVYTYKFGEDDIPCWSLAALLRELPDAMLGKDKDGYVVMVETMGSGLTAFASDPVDACVEMISQLKEKNLL